MIHLNNRGTGYEIGFQHGASCPQAVRSAYQAYGCPPGVTEAHVEAGVRLVEARLGRHFPDMLDELHGIADGSPLFPQGDGSGLTFEQIVTLSCYDVVIAAAEPARHCSTIGFADSDAGVLLGKTADWNVAGAVNFTAWQRFEPAAGKGHTFVHYGCAGTVWTEGGLNDAGLGMVLNGLPVFGSGPDSVPWPPLTRGVLQFCDSVQSAIQFLARYDVLVWGFSLTLADASGDLALVEVTPGAQAVRRPEPPNGTGTLQGYLIHTNHPLCLETSGRQLDAADLARHGEPGLDRNSLARYRTLERIVPRAPRTLASMQALLRDRSSPGAISQHGEDGQHTVYAMIIAPAQGRLWGAEGFPPQVPFVEYAV
jgi:Acyl-coenzyme A:6-aminopenicillanic acid acyl-transferase